MPTKTKTLVEGAAMSDRKVIGTIPSWVVPGVLVNVSEKAIKACDVILALANNKHSTLKATFDDDQSNTSPPYNGAEGKSLTYLVLSAEYVSKREMSNESYDLYAYLEVLNSDGQVMVMGVRPVFKGGTTGNRYGAETRNFFSRAE